ncbi:MAG: heavy-metal-associated domain-containing protein [Dehalococcoidia bacterium]
MSQTMKTDQLRVEGMTCENCVRHVTKALQGVAGVSSVQVDLAAGRASVEYDPGQATVEAMAAAIKEAGYAVPAVT